MSRIDSRSRLRSDLRGLCDHDVVEVPREPSEQWAGGTNTGKVAWTFPTGGRRASMRRDESSLSPREDLQPNAASWAFAPFTPVRDFQWSAYIFPSRLPV